MMLYTLLYLIIFIILLYKGRKSLYMLQQSLYNENNRYLKWVFKNRKDFFDLELIIVFIAAVGYFVTFDLEMIPSILLIIMIILYGIKIIFLEKDKSKEQNKIAFKITARVKRLIITFSILMLIPLIFFILNVENSNTTWLIIFIITILVYLNRIVMWIVNIINKPAEKCVFLYYKTKAQNKLKSMPNLKVIGITGSYGKTSSKNILNDILNIKYNALPTPRNLNTFYGLMITINNHLTKFEDIFIAEMGAYVKGEIKGLCKFVKPKYGILTRIGKAHLESFGSEENIQEAKFELIESLPIDGIGVLNMDDEKQVSYQLKNKCRIIWIAIDNEEADVRATDIKCSKAGTSFNIILKGDKKKYPFTTKLLGKHNVYNILASVALGLEFGITIDKLKQAVLSVKPVPHRLELKPLGKFYQIADDYNSNPVGAKSAVEVLGMMPGVKVVVTPGMIELGEDEEKINEEFGKQIASVADYVVLIGKKRTKPIYNGLVKKNFDQKRIVVYNDVREAFPFIDSLTGKQEVYALFENDLPDTYNE